MFIPFMEICQLTGNYASIDEAVLNDFIAIFVNPIIFVINGAIIAGILLAALIVFFIIRSLLDMVY